MPGAPSFAFFRQREGQHDPQFPRLVSGLGFSHAAKRQTRVWALAVVSQEVVYIEVEA